MASVFLSYDREDSAKARPIALALQKSGHSVWWDLHVRGGAQFSKVIEEALKAADAVVVLWSRHSIESAWVRDEAAAGRDTGRLVPLTIDGTEPPLGFRQFQTLDLSRWKAGRRLTKFQELVASIEAIERQQRADGTSEPDTRTHDQTQGGRRLALVGISAAVFLAALLSLFAWKPWSSRSVVPIVSVHPGDESAQSKALARDLLVQLGDYQAGHPKSVEVVDEDTRRNPDVFIEVSARSLPQPSANLLVLRGGDRLILASQEFSAEPGNASDLQQALSMGAVRLIDCTAETLSSKPSLRQDLAKLYMGACARFGGLYGSDDIALIEPALEEITRRAPSFVPAWRHLLLAGASLLSLPSDRPKPNLAWLRKQIEGARAADPNVQEIGVAELELLPPTAFRQRLQKIEAVERSAAANAAVLDAHAEQLMTVGRNNDAVALAEKAALLDPSSPAARATYVRALAYSGRLPAAMQNLKDWAPLQLGSKNLLETRFRINMRYGDPKDALKLLHRYGTSRQHETFLNARIDPSSANVREAILTSQTVADNLQVYGAHAEVLAAFGRNDDLFQLLMSLAPTQVEQGLLSTVFRPNLKALRQEPRFMQIAQRFGLVDFWRSTGKWPDFCSEPELPYDCKHEAAKLSA